MSDHTTIDRDGLIDILEEHPVSVAVLFGSVVDGQPHANSDIDVAIEFDDSVDDVVDALVTLNVDLTSALCRDDIDLGVLNDLDPRIGLTAVNEGEVLVGDPGRLVDHRERFEAEIDDRPPARDRFTAVIERVDEALQG